MKAANVTPQSIEQATAALAQLPERPKENYSLREAIAQLQGTINAVLERGYSHQDVAGMLSESGIRISPASLKSYLAAVNREATETPKKRRISRKAKLEQDALQAVEEAPRALEEVIAPPEPAPEPEPEPAPQKTRGRRTANKTKPSAPAKGRKAAPAGPSSRRKKAGAAS